MTHGDRTIHTRHIVVMYMTCVLFCRAGKCVRQLTTHYIYAHDTRIPMRLINVGIVPSILQVSKDPV